MSLMKDIAKLTAPPPGDKVRAKFIPLNGRGRAEQDLEMNNHPVRLRNGHNRSLFEEGLEPTGYDEIEYDERYLDEIRSSVRAVNGGEFSNTHLEEHIRKRQLEASKNNDKLLSSQASGQNSDSTSTLSSYSTTTTSESCEKLENEQLENRETLTDNFENNKLYKNCVIRGLLNKNIISIADLDISDKTKTIVENCPRLNLVEHPDDPDLLINPLEAYGRLQYTKDFVLDRIGTKETMTPRQYYMSLDDSAFEFVKKSN